MEEILNCSKEYEQIAIQNDPMYKDMEKMTDLVKQFIIKHKLILYGGTAIDYALRLKGTNIYPDSMLAVPDLDFYSPNHTEHAYILADMMYEAGYTEARAIVAEYSRAMKVDIGDNHWIADLSYIPQKIFDNLPYIIYEGMRVIHPDFQKNDMHISFTYPYANPPREAIFSRWKKDTERFNILNHYYPTVFDDPKLKGMPSTQIIQLPLEFRRYIFTGFIGYAFIYSHFEEIVKNHNAQIPDGITASILKITGGMIHVEIYNDCLELISHRPESTVKKLSLTNVQKYYPLINLLGKRYIGYYNKKNKTTVFDTSDKIVAINSLTREGQKYRFMNVQGILQYFNGMIHISYGLEKKLYIDRYNSLIKMIEFAETILTKADAVQSPLFPSINTYGYRNHNLAYQVGMGKINADLGRSPPVKIPINYYPAKGNDHPKFNVDDSPIFQESGEPF